MGMLEMFKCVAKIYTVYLLNLQIVQNVKELEKINLIFIVYLQPKEKIVPKYLTVFEREQ